MCVCVGGGGGVFAGHYNICLPSHCVLSLHPLPLPPPPLPHTHTHTPTPTHFVSLPPRLSSPQTHPYPQCSNNTWYNHRVPLWDRQCVTSVIQYATDIEKALSEAATSEERYYQLLCENIYQISKKEQESKKIKVN